MGLFVESASMDVTSFLLNSVPAPFIFFSCSYTKYV